MQAAHHPCSCVSKDWQQEYSLSCQGPRITRRQVQKGCRGGGSQQLCHVQSCCPACTCFYLHTALLHSAEHFKRDCCPHTRRLRDVLWDHSRLYLIMDYVDLDLREHMDTDPDSSSLQNVKVTTLQLPLLSQHAVGTPYTALDSCSPLWPPVGSAAATLPVHACQGLAHTCMHSQDQASCCQHIHPCTPVWA